MTQDAIGQTIKFFISLGKAVESLSGSTRAVGAIAFTRGYNAGFQAAKQDVEVPQMRASGEKPCLVLAPADIEDCPDTERQSILDVDSSAPAGGAVKPAMFTIGDRVEPMPDCDWIAHGQVVNVSSNGQFEVLWDDGVYGDHSAESMIKEIE